MGGSGSLREYPPKRRLNSRVDGAPGFVVVREGVAREVRGLARRGGAPGNLGRGSMAGNATLLREYLGCLRVEKGLRPLTCEAYQRDLEMFAEFLEGTS